MRTSKQIFRNNSKYFARKKTKKKVLKTTPIQITGGDNTRVALVKRHRQSWHVLHQPVTQPPDIEKIIHEQLSQKWAKSFIKLALRTLDRENF